MEIEFNLKFMSDMSIYDDRNVNTNIYSISIEMKWEIFKKSKNDKNIIELMKEYNNKNIIKL